jgi:hypothetical protein
MPSGFHIGDGASVYTRAPCQLDLRPTQPAACRLYVRTFHSLNVLRLLMAKWSRCIAQRDNPF